MKVIRRIMRCCFGIVILVGCITIGMTLNEAFGGKPVSMRVLRVLFWIFVPSAWGMVVAFVILLFSRGGV